MYKLLSFCICTSSTEEPSVGINYLTFPLNCLTLKVPSNTTVDSTSRFDFATQKKLAIQVKTSCTEKSNDFLLLNKFL